MAKARPTAKPSSRTRVARHRAAQRRKGLRLVQRWVDDTSTPEFAAMAAREMALAAASPDSDEVMDWIERNSVLEEMFDSDDAPEIADDDAAPG